MTSPEPARKLSSKHLSSKEKSQILSVPSPHLLSVRVSACRGHWWPPRPSLLSAPWMHLCPSSRQLQERQESTERKRTSLWFMALEVSIHCVTPLILGMWQGRNIMTEGHSKEGHSKRKLFTLCRQEGGTEEQEERCGGGVGVHPQQPSSNHPLASNNPFTC